MRRAYKFLLRPTARQAAALNACLHDHRQLYNAALAERREAYRRASLTVRYAAQSKQLAEIRRADPDGQGRWSFSSQQATLRRLDRAMRGFFRRVKAGQKPGYPRFKGAGSFDSVEWPQDRDGCRWNSTPDGTVRVYLQGVGHVRVHRHRGVQGRVKTLVVKREANRWYLILSCDDISPRPLPFTGKAVGIDMGLASFLTTSDGVKVDNPRFLASSTNRIQEAQRALVRCKSGSKRRCKVSARIAAVGRKVRHQRLDHAHKIASWLVRHHDVIAHEDLRIVNMTRSAAGTIDAPGVMVAAKSGLNRSILDAGWGVFLSILAAKAESAGRAVIAVNPRNTSRICPACGHCAKENRVTQARFVCARCGHAAHADVVGARNVLRAGLARQAAGAA